MRKRQKVQKKVHISTAEERKQIWVADQGQRPNKKLPTLPHPKDAGKPPPLVEGSLEDESDVALLASQLLGTEGTGGVEGVCAVGQRDLTPEARRLL